MKKYYILVLMLFFVGCGFDANDRLFVSMNNKAYQVPYGVVYNSYIERILLDCKEPNMPWVEKQLYQNYILKYMQGNFENKYFTDDPYIDKLRELSKKDNKNLSIEEREKINKEFEETLLEWKRWLQNKLYFKRLAGCERALSRQEINFIQQRRQAEKQATQSLIQNMNNLNRNIQQMNNNNLNQINNINKFIYRNY